MKSLGLRIPLVSAAVALALVLPGVASAQTSDRHPQQFSTGSGKADFAGTLQEHLSLSAHSDQGPAHSGHASGCPAHGSVEYTFDSPGNQFQIKADVTDLVIGPTLASGLPTAAFIVGEITSYTQNGVQQAPPLTYAWFDVVDSGLQGGKGDQVTYEGPREVRACLLPITGEPITQGNIVIKTMETILLSDLFHVDQG